MVPNFPVQLGWARWRSKGNNEGKAEVPALLVIYLASPFGFPKSLDGLLILINLLIKYFFPEALKVAL